MPRIRDVIEFDFVKNSGRESRRIFRRLKPKRSRRQGDGDFHISDVCLTCHIMRSHDSAWRIAEISWSTPNQKRCRSRSHVQSKSRQRTRSSTKLGYNIFTPGISMKTRPPKHVFDNQIRPFPTQNVFPKELLDTRVVLPLPR